MKTKKIRLITALALGSIVLSGCYVDLGFMQIGNPGTTDSDESGAYDAKKDLEEISTYYASINGKSSGTTLLNSLRSLNLGKRTSVAGYAGMGTSSSQKFKYTDYDPQTVKFNADGVPYGTRVLSFYSGKSVSTFNREHVWPKSRGGDLVEDDILMVRPTINEENSDRGNSVYATGVATEFNGWDPVTAFAGSIGVAKNIRGECARIVFYCLTITGDLVINDTNANQKNNMGKLSDLVEWACENPVTEREKRRNIGAQFLQGNRNAFVDHPEYVCKIWGSSNSRTKSACSRANYPIN